MTKTTKHRATDGDHVTYQRGVLNKWLKRVGARKLWETVVNPNEPIEFVIEAWQIGIHVVLVQDWGPDGWQLYIPSSNTNTTAAALDAAAEALHVEGCAGLINQETALWGSATARDSSSAGDTRPR